MNQNEVASKRAVSKKKIAVWNRRLAWVTLPTFLVSTFAYYAAKWGYYPNWMTFAGISSMIFILLFFAHTIFSLYLFGFPKFKWQTRVIHIYIGYLLFIFTLVSQSIIGLEPYHVIAYSIMWIVLIAHVSLSFRFMLKRNVKKNVEPSLNFRGEKTL